MVQRLPDTSMTIALASGGREHFGWGVDRYLAANTYDAVNANTRMTGSYAKGKAPKFDEFPRPKTTDAKKQPVTVKDLFRSISKRRG